MRDFFRGWRRKIGVTSLMFALLFVGLWGRGQCTEDDQFSVRADEDNVYTIGLIPAGIRIVKLHTFRSDGQRMTMIQHVGELNYWSVVIPLTLLSAYLLLSRQRKPDTREPNVRLQTQADVQPTADRL